MKIKGVLVVMLVHMDLVKYGPNVLYEKVIQVLYIEVPKYIYCVLQSTHILSWENIWRQRVLKFNPYDPCVANKIIEGEPLTIVFRVDDTK